MSPTKRSARETTGTGIVPRCCTVHIRPQFLAQSPLPKLARAAGVQSSWCRGEIVPNDATIPGSQESRAKTRSR